MPPTKVPPHTNGSAFRSVGGFAPLALSLLVGNAVLPSSNGEGIVRDSRAGDAVRCGDDLVDFRDCHAHYPTGCSKAGQYDAYLNLLKNSIAPPPALGAVKYLTPADIASLEKSLPAGLSRSNHARFAQELTSLEPFAEQQAAGLIGYLYYVEKTGAESSNCELSGDEDVDYHIGIGFDPQLAELVRSARISHTRLTGQQRKRLTQTAMVVEMTPHYRAYYQPNWSLDDLQNVLGAKVRVEGQLIVDSEHHVAAQDCGIEQADSLRCWRATAWELHPVKRFQVCAGSRCDQDSSDWAELEAARSVATASSPQ